MTARTPHPLSWALALTLAAPLASADQAGWRELPLAVSAERIALAAGLTPPVERWRLLYDVSARIHPASGGHAGADERRRAVEAELTSARGDAETSALSVPVPLAPDLWRQAVLERPAADAELPRQILRERSAALVYRAVCRLDPETLSFLARHPGLLARIRLEQPEAFALVAGSLRVRSGRVVVPGGTEAAALWEDVVGAQVEQAESFLLRLLTRKEGRLALLLHAIDGLDPARQRFALGLAVPDAERRAERFRALARASARAPVWWKALPESPQRPLFDPPSVLGRAAVTETGLLSRPASRALWEAAFADREETDPAALEAGEPVDAAWLAEHVGQLPTPLARARVVQLGFAQRVFAETPAAALPQVLTVVRQLSRRPALLLVLERLGLEAPESYVEVLAGADALEALPRRARLRALAQFSGALAAIDLARRNGVLETQRAQALALSLARLRPGAPGYWDTLAAWLDSELVPALGAAVGEASPAGAEEDVWLQALAGERATPLAAPTFDWEGLPTRAEPATAERMRLERVRRRQGGNALDLALTLTRLARQAAAGDHEPVPAALRALRIEVSPFPAGEQGPQLPALLRAVAAGHTEELQRLADLLLADTLVALAYAPHLGQADGPVLAGASVARRHDLGEQPFDLPQEISGRGIPWHVRGSLLALEVALAPFSLRRLTPEPPPRPPACDPAMLASFALSVALRNPFVIGEGDAAAAVAAMERGRTRAAALLAGPHAAPAVARAAALDPWRAQALPWLLAHEPEALEGFFSLAELLRLGGPVDLPPQAWGLPELPLGGRLGLGRPAPTLLDTTVGQDRRELLAAALEGPLLKVTAELHSRRLPACLTPAVLALLTQSIADEGPAELGDEPRALARFLGSLPPERFDDFVSALAGDGPLVPAEPVATTGAP